MVQVITAPNEAFNLLLYPEQNQANVAWVQNQFQNLGATFTGLGQKFMEEAKTIYHNLQNSEVVQRARNLLRSANAQFHSSAIQPLVNIESLQAASYTMMRWVMAEPTTRALYQKQQIDGYADLYQDPEPNCIAENHYDYRRVVNGILQENTEGDLTITEYFELLKEGDRELEFHEQVDILRTWDIVKMFIEAADEDPTNPLGGKMA